MGECEEMTEVPRLSAVVVHWRDEEHLAELVDAWPEADSRFELLVVDNSASLDPLPPSAQLLDPGKNLGFAGGVNHGVAVARGQWILILNPDARPLPGALTALLEAMDGANDVAGFVPALEGPEGESQHRWQLQPLPSPTTLLLQTLFLAGSRGPQQPPPAGSPVEQPAAAALLVRRKVLRELGGLDEGFYPAWFEDVDLARRLADAGHRLHYLPAARFVHAMGGSVPQFGYGPFLWVYYRNLCRYLRRHHGALWEAAARGTVLIGMFLRLLLLPFRRPRRAANRWQAATALLDVARGAATAWRRPRGHARYFRLEKEVS
jgi:GT2 family glycosyltransferase